MISLSAFYYVSYQREESETLFEKRVLALKEHLEMKHSRDIENLIKMITEKKELNVS